MFCIIYIWKSIRHWKKKPSQITPILHITHTQRKSVYIYIQIKIEDVYRVFGVYPSDPRLGEVV